MGQASGYKEDRSARSWATQPSSAVMASLMDLNRTPTKVRDSYTASLPALRRKLLSSSAPLSVCSSPAFDAALFVTMTSNTDANVPHSKPIPINARRDRADSVSDSSSSEESASPVSPSNSPISGMPPRVVPSSPGSTPILNYFLSQSPKSPTTSTFPFRRAFGTAAFEGL
ncbi:uncharacterized protein PHACADRAFT_252897 [Phanerochaete carnosa HHB-10118-sp]|uniref:Uncharacterized protein n=1 Tax=Phanerochaete carnosa (strain HHB-10118-sp) TaxID=650164 RepID=K5X6L1_PHACS|nr:uncharacterized protein PHACADRAFT_252897 [Phanerochaete carnosa HHB-10118-sp]EKM58512.1 hypothetical protein PHACADRAFT_252897 [Phanerochaete carnosa HHB-10118-sp]